MRIRDHFNHNSLFVIMFIITFISIICVSMIITWTTIRMSEDFFIDKFSITNAKVINQVKEGFESFHASIVTASNNLLQSGNLRTILTSEHSNSEKMTIYFELNQLMNRIKPNVDAYDVSISVTGFNDITYSTDRAYWPISDEELKKSSITSNTINEPKKLMYQFDKRQSTLLEGEEETFVVASRALMERISGKVYGSVYVAIQESEFQKFYTNFTSQGNDVLIIDRDGMIVSSNRPEFIGKQNREFLRYAKEIKNSSKSYVTKKFMGADHIFFAEYLPSFDMYIFNII
ncbi:MAG TPA: cache domain-containing protein, partial [Metabacillus sp.]|nr:cache domain-containing protein [Metabacillus sp.]